MKYLAHLKNGLGDFHNLDDHLRSVGELAEKYISEANPELCEQANWAGLLHDLGKYRDEFQAYIKSEGKIASSNETHHAIYGAALALIKGWNILAFAIAGHHAGLHNFEDLKNSINKPDYQIHTSNVLEELQQKFRNDEILPPIPQTFGEISLIKDNFQFEFATRMIFSALIDADRYDTARHSNNWKMPETLKLNPSELLEKLEKVRQSKSDNAKKNGIDEKLLNLRNQIFADCLREAEKERGFFSLTVPTGGAKTLAAMAFALKHAEIYKMRRVIVVIPYLSIIEQNAKEYRDAFGNDVVIENHSAVEVEEKSDDQDDMNPLSLITENWDAPIIVTTSVQFIESLFARKPARCRKLHNIANSVVIFDEIQTLPVKLLEPLFSVWRELKENYGVSFVFSTATQPAFRKQNNFPNGFAELDEKHPLREITSNTKQIYKDLNRVSYDFSNFTKPQTWKQIAAEMENERQILCVVNTRKHAFELWNELSGKLAEPREHGIHHLSSAMCAEHRLQTIAAIKSRLANNLTCQVVSTQLVEAGVDLDFPVLYRAIAPLDSIVQAAGRCNREGKLEKGRVKVFMPENNNLPKGIYKNATEITCTMNLDSETLANDYEIFSKYFQLLYKSNDTGQEIQKLRNEMKFKTVSEKAKVIEKEGIGIIVQFGKSSEIIEEIRNRGINKNRNTDFIDFKKEDWRRLQRFTVNLWETDFEKLNKLGQLRPLLEGKKIELFVLDIGSYHNELGVLTNERPINEFYGGI
jgi:CRISPR-associated endonuclease/helicase Cas3